MWIVHHVYALICPGRSVRTSQEELKGRHDQRCVRFRQMHDEQLYMFHFVSTLFFPLHLISRSNMAYLLNMLDPDHLIDIPTRFVSFLARQGSFDNIVGVVIRMVLVGALVAGARRLASWAYNKMSRGISPSFHLCVILLNLSSLPNRLYCHWRCVLSLDHGVDIYRSRRSTSNSGFPTQYQ